LGLILIGWLVGVLLQACAYQIETLAIAPETVKSHVKHVFVKLGVEKRAQAVSRAQSLGLAQTL
jgi:ATP/maltotriose-dependent transcriptional regulator MalT